MGCTTGKTNKHNKIYQKIRKCNISPQEVSKKEMVLLNLMFENLSCRSRDQIISKQTFDAFLYGHGLIGQLLFSKFDSKKNQKIEKEEFLDAFETMVKGSDQEMFDSLFDLYDIDQTGGIKFQQLMKVLGSYPIQVLNKMFTQRKFIQFLGKGKISYYFGSAFKIQEKDIVVQQSMFVNKENNDNHNNSMDCPKISNVKCQTNYVQSMILPKGAKRNYVIKSNIAFLIKKYTQYLFQKEKLDKNNDMLSKNQFYRIIDKNPEIFNVYFEGFHTDLWQIDQNQKPLFTEIKSWIQSPCKILYQKTTKKAYLKFLKTSIFVFQDKEDLMPVEIINLQGLFVEIIQNTSNQYGLKFKHKNGIYPEKIYLFDDEETLKKWKQYLKQYVNKSIEYDYRILQRIGGGAFSNVFEGINLNNENNVAIKVIQKYKLSGAERKVLEKQCKILKRCHHRNIVKFVDEYDKKTHRFIVMELLNEGNLYDYTAKKGFLEQYQAAVIFKQVTQSLYYLHKQLGIINRDLKPQNIMIQMHDNEKIVNKIKLIDFGLAVYKDQLDCLPSQERFVGTHGFIAPEIYKGEDYDEKVDTFSLGIILYFMLSGQLPFQSNHDFEIQRMTVNCQLRMEGNHWANISLEAKKLIKSMLIFKGSRLSAKQVLESQWLKDIESLKEKNGINRRKKRVL